MAKKTAASTVFPRKAYTLRLPTRSLALGKRTLIMGVLNVTPDSFYHESAYLDSPAAIAHALQMERAGADLLDIGGESTRPGADPVGAEEEMARVLPVIKGLRGILRIPISLDTQKATVAEAGIAAGVELINDVSGLRYDPMLAEVLRRRRVGLILMHMRGKPGTMQLGPFARDVVSDVIEGLRSALRRAERAGIAESRILVDPGIGFGKRYEQNFELLARLPEMANLDFPIMVGASRKAFLGWALADPKLAGRKSVNGESTVKASESKERKTAAPLPPEERLWGTAATVAAAIFGGAHIVRVHDVAEMSQVARVSDAIMAETAAHRSRRRSNTR